MNILDVLRKGPSVYVHCPTPEEAKRILYMSGKYGGRWYSGQRYFNETYWRIYKEDTVYILNFKPLLGSTFASRCTNVYNTEINSENIIPSLAINDENEN